MNKGILLAIGAYGLWGLFPLYWKLLDTVPALQILAHRFVWCLVFVVLLIILRKEWPVFRTAISQKKVIAIYAVAVCLLAVNWFVYIWGVNAGFIIETSLGYFINPLVNVLLGVVFLKERLRPLQWLPVGLAVAGVIYLTASYGSLPWIALVLATTFGFYGLLKKVAPLGSLHGLTLETALLFLPMAGLLLFYESQGVGAFGHVNLGQNTLLVLSGVVTALPLLLFASAARRIHLSTMGLIQYMAPTLQFSIGVLIYHEPFDSHRLVGFSLIWLALAIYSIEGIMAASRRPASPLQPGTSDR